MVGADDLRVSYGHVFLASFFLPINYACILYPYELICTTNDVNTYKYFMEYEKLETLTDLKC